MLEAFFDHPFSINRLRAGPAGPYIDGYAQSLKDIKYARETSRRYLRSASHLGRFVEL
ncbi:MAG: integrase, partial [bacterium]|nr:integrase [bacterium]